MTVGRSLMMFSVFIKQYPDTSPPTKKYVLVKLYLALEPIICIRLFLLLLLIKGAIKELDFSELTFDMEFGYPSC